MIKEWLTMSIILTKDVIVTIILISVLIYYISILISDTNKKFKEVIIWYIKQYMKWMIMKER